MPLPSRNIVMYEAGRASGSGSPHRPPVIVEALPEIGEYGVTYLVANGGAAPNLYDEYIWVSPEAGYELLGQKEVDLSHYVRDTRTINGHALTANVEVTYADLQDKPSIEGVTLSGNKTAADLGLVPDTRKVGGVPLSADIPVTLTGDAAITVTNTGTASAIGYSVAHNDSGVTAGSKGDATAQTPGFGGTFKVLSATVDAKGHVTALADHTTRIPSDTATSAKDGLMSKDDKTKLDAIGVTASAPLEVTKSGETYNVALKDSGVTAGSKGDTTNQTPSFGGTFKVLSATVDAKGHVTNLAEHTTMIPNTPATQNTAGLMSAADKTKLDTIIDATLSHDGQAADAKATGDKIAELQSLLSRMEIYCEASGNPATFSDGYPANVRKLAVTLTPTQSGSGDPSPSNVRPISGVSSVSVTRTGKNLLPIIASSSADNYTHTLNADGSVTLSGSGATMGEQTRIHMIANNIRLPPGIYKILVTFESGASNFGIEGYLPANSASGRANSTYFHLEATPPNAKSVTFTVWKNDYMNVYSWIPDRTADVSGTVKVMIVRADETDDSFEAYQGQSATVSLVDSNSNPLTVYGGTLDVTTGELSVTYRKLTLTSSMISSAAPHKTGFPGVWLNGYENQMAQYPAYNPDNIEWNTAYSLCNTVPIESNPYARSIRGICLRYTTGLLLRLAASDIPGFEDTNDEATIISAVGQFLDNNAVELVYRLATPLTYTLTPAQLATLSGYNSVSADAETLSVTYRADPSITLGGG